MTKAKPAAATILPQKMWPLDRIKPYPNNPRTHPPAQIDTLARLLRQYGPDQPIVVDEDGIILKGHGRRLGAYLAKLKAFPVIQRIGLTETEKRAMRIEDNQVALLSGWDPELIRGEIASLRTLGYDVALLGFGEAQLVNFETLPGPPAGGFPAFGSDIATDHECPKCSYRWSGSSAPRQPAQPKSKKKRTKKK